MKQINYLLQAIFVYIFFFIGFILRLNISRKLFSSLFSFVGPLFKSQKIIENNLNIFSKKFSKIDEKRIIKSMWKNYGMTFIEYVFLNNFLKDSSHLNIKGKEVLTNLSDNGNPVIFVSGHFANFELMSMEITKHNIPLATIYRPLNNKFINPFMEYLRKKYICKNQIKKGINGVRDSIEFIKNNHSIALMIDQRVSEGEKVNFFNKPAFTTTLPAQLSTKYEMDIIPVFIERDKKNNFRIEFKKRINPKNFKDKLDLTKKLNKVLEEMIIKNPNQWIWTHDRWK